MVHKTAMMVLLALRRECGPGLMLLLPDDFPVGHRAELAFAWHKNPHSGVARRYVRGHEKVPVMKRLVNMVVLIVTLLGVLNFLFRRPAGPFRMGAPPPPAEDFNLYHVLGLENGASFKEIRHAYRSLAQKYHPDTHPGCRECPERFRKIADAYKQLLELEAGPARSGQR